MRALSIIHPFEEAGLGLAPFRCIGVERRVGPIQSTDPKYPGVTFEIGAPGQPMGTCDFCGNGIADCYVILSSDGKRFVVGCDCVRRTYAAAGQELPPDVRREMARVRREANAKRADARRAKLAATAATLLVEARALLAAEPALFTDAPHPAIAGKTLRDYFEFCMASAGNDTRIAICRRVLGAKVAK